MRVLKGKEEKERNEEVMEKQGKGKRREWTGKQLRKLESEITR